MISIKVSTTTNYKPKDTINYLGTVYTVINILDCCGFYRLYIEEVEIKEVETIN